MKYFPLSILAPRRSALLKQKKNTYSQQLAPSSIVSRQLVQFNAVWQQALLSNEFYQYWQKKHQLPQSIQKIEELQEFPIINKLVINEYEDLIHRVKKKRKDAYYISTGGSSGTPIKLPTSAREKDNEYALTYLGKSWWNIYPFAPIIHLWGHSHLFGSGLLGKWREKYRCIKDFLINTQRLNAYNMSVECLKEYALQIAQKRPTAIIGYTSALYKLAQYAKSHTINLGNKNLRAVILTAETVTHADISVLQEVFRAPVVIEYGMAETGVLAYSKESWQRQYFFWDSFIGTLNKNNVLHVSTLYDRVFPLINYCTEDIITGPELYTESLLSYASVAGRMQHNLFLWNKKRNKTYTLSAILLVHIIKSIPEVLAVSAEQWAEGVIKVFISSINQNIKEYAKKMLLSHLQQELGEIDSSSILVIMTQQEYLTLAGKQEIVLTPGSGSYLKQR